MLRVAVIAAATAEPLEEVVHVLSPGGFAVVVQCHADATALDLLQPRSRLPISEARGRVRLQRDQVFVVPPDCDAVFHRDELVVMPGGQPRAPIDQLLRSLADEYASHGTGVILSGHGNDGVLGIKRLKEAGGLTIAQLPDPDDDGMARSAIATGMIDLVLPLSAIAERLAALAPPPSEEPTPVGATEAAPARETADALHDILAFVRLRAGHDFGSYKRATLYRRVSRRMQVCQCTSIAGYLGFLREHPGEIANLLRDFLISVTNFFRDREAFDALAVSVIPRLFAGRGAGDQVRVWVAGCATGEEAYSIGMLLCEYASTLRAPPQLQIFATDIDEDALAEARTGRYPSTIAVDVSPERLRRFFVPEGDSHRVTKELRDIVLFSPHSLLRDPPFSRLDLISCRNLLIYLNRDAQDRVLQLFHFGLRPDGFLLLGSSESAENTTMFAAFDGKLRLFVRRPAPIRLAEAMVPEGRWAPALPAPPSPAPPVERVSAGELHHQLVERYAPPSVLVDDNLEILHISERAGGFLQVAAGEPSRQLLRLIHPALRLELRTAIHTARPAARASTRVVRFDDAGRPRAVELRVRTIAAGEPGGPGMLVLFDELEPSPATPIEPSASTMLEPMVRELEDELRRTRDQLRGTVEQYETSVEELKASNEELQAINEELRSATEELETSKEELQSVNEELTTLNHELNLKVDEVSHANSDLQNLMTSTEIGVVFLDRELNIKRFTPRAQDLFNVIPSDLGRPLAHLTHRLDRDDLPELARSVLQTLRVVEREVETRDGRRYLARLLPYRSLEDRIDGVVLTFIEVSDLRNAVAARERSEAALQAIEQRLRFALRTAPMLVVGLDAELRSTWGYLCGEELELADDGGERAPGLLARFVPEHTARFAAIAHDVMRDGDGRRAELDVSLHGERRTYDLRIERDDRGVIAVGFDITPSKLAEATLRDADHRKDEFLATLSHQLRNPLTPLKVALDLAASPDADPIARARAHGIMARQVVQLTQLVDDLLDLSQITQGKIEL